MKNENFKRIEEKIKAFPPLPATVANILDIVNNPESSAKQLTQAILPDQSMCVAILKYANSALYGRPKKVSSLETAIMVLGFDEIRNIVLSRSVVTSFNHIFKKNASAINEFWDHSFTCALGARVIADHLSLPSPGQFFIGGLIHDIGKLAMLLTFPDDYLPQKWLVGFSDPVKQGEELALFSIGHAEVGSRLLRKWNFPDHLIAALEFHHQPERAPAFIGFALLIQLADALACLCAHPETLEGTNVISAIHALVPDLEERWVRENLPWSDVRLDSWYSWLRIDRAHGSSILSILSN